MRVSLHKKITAREQAKTGVLHLGKKVTLALGKQHIQTVCKPDSLFLGVLRSNSPMAQWKRVFLLRCSQLCPNPISSPFQVTGVYGGICYRAAERYWMYCQDSWKCQSRSSSHQKFSFLFMKT